MVIWNIQSVFIRVCAVLLHGYFISSGILYCYLLRQGYLFSAAQPWRVLPTGFVCTVSLYLRPCVLSYPIQHGVPKDINSGSHCLCLFCSEGYTIGKDGSALGTPTNIFFNPSLSDLKQRK